MKPTEFLCTQCGAQTSAPLKVSPGSPWVAFVLAVPFLVPGVAYAVLVNGRDTVFPLTTGTPDLQYTGPSADQMTPDAAVLATNHSNLFVLPAGSIAKPPAEHFTGTRWAELLGWCSETFKVIIVDTPPVRPMTDFDLLVPTIDGGEADETTP